MTACTALPDLSRLKPAGGKRSSKREQIVNVFLRQEGHLSADDLVDLIRKEDQRISRATVYRTLQWMVDAGIARKVDFGEGRFRFEHSLPAAAPLPSDLQDLQPVVRVPQLRHRGAGRGGRGRAQLQRRRRASSRFTARARSAAPDARASTEHGHTDLVFARDALRIAIATERSGLEFYTRAPRRSRAMRAAARCSRIWRRRRRSISASSKARYARAAARDPQLESRPTFLFFKGAANGLFAEGAERLMRGVNDQQALMIGIRCERGSHRFFKKYGERFEDSEGKQIFLEFADEEREHLDLLVREYRALVKRQGRTQPRFARHGPTASHRAIRAVTIDLHLHTTASDGRCSPRRAGRPRRRRTA